VFWKRIDNEASDNHQELRDFFADRLRLAFDFATLGAYELTEGDCERPLSGGDATAPVERGGHVACATTTGHALRRHVGEASLPCPAPAEGRRAPASCTRGGRRPGSVQVPEQPCVCSGR
jgi:hypothetical protein